jgi:Ca-activated chloride channel family protein
MSDFARPWLVVLALGTPLLLGWLTAVRRRHQRVPALAVRRRPLLGGLAVASPILALCGLAAAWLAAAGPRRASFRSEPSAGRNFVVLLDASASMAEPRGGFEAARTAVERFIALRRADRVALVLFGRRAAVLAPLTHDHATLLALVHKLSPTALGNETAIGDGLAVALGLLDGTPRGSGAIVLVSDGRNNASIPAPQRRRPPTTA